MVPLASPDIDKALEIFAQAKRIHGVCHRNPDGDAVGSLTGIALLLEKHYPDKQILLHCVDPVPATFQFLPAAKRVQSELVTQPGDAVVFVDSAEPKLTEYHETHRHLFDKSIPTVVIDHHYSNTRFGTVNIVEDVSSACEAIALLAKRWKWTLTPEIATCLLTGIYTDTGGLLHSNTTPAVYRTVAELMKAGARHERAMSAVFRTAKLSTLKLWGRVLEKISITEEGGAISAVTEGDFRATGADRSELTGAIDYVNAVPGMRFSLVLSEHAGKVKGSLRTLRDDVDVSAMAGKFQGGGHKKAAGFAVQGKLKPEVRWKVVEGPASEQKDETRAGN